MKNKDFQRAMAYEALILLGLLALLTFVTRLWPILLMVILGIFAAIIRLLFLSVKDVKPDQPILALPAGRAEPQQPDMETMAFMIVQRRITQILCEQYPNVRWIWENSRAKEDLLAGRELYVLLNRAGGYRRAKIIVRNLQVFDVVVQSSERPAEQVTTGSTAMQKPVAQEDEEDADESESTAEVGTETAVPEDFGLLAFQWVETHILELSGRCNEAIAAGCHELEIPEEELPVRESWEEICKELARNELPDAKASESGILIKF